MSFDTPTKLFLASSLLLAGVLFALFGQTPQAMQTALLPRKASPPQEAEAQPQPAKVHLDDFGIEREAFAYSKGRVQRGQTLANILADHDVPYRTAARIERQAKSAFDVRNIRPGHTYRLYQRSDSLRSLQYFVYHRDPINYVLFELNDSLRVIEKARKVDVVTKEVAATIDGSLYETLSDAGSPTELASKLAKVYAWQIDFFRTQEGDRFKALYQEYQIDGKPVGIGKIVAARFTHMGHDFYGFRFVQDGNGDYFDENAQSLRKAFLKAPLEYEAITSGYTKKRYHPILKRNRPHLGTDYAADTGTPIRSVGDGIVVEAKRERWNGRFVKIRHNTTYSTQYLHMSKIADGIEAGERVHQGDVIGYVGETGLATGPHLCYRFWKNGKQVDPYKEKIPPAHPVDSLYLDEYNALKDSLMRRLNDVPRILADTAQEPLLPSPPAS